jgi:hypothetical protein
MGEKWSRDWEDNGWMNLERRELVGGGIIQFDW